MSYQATANTRACAISDPVLPGWWGWGIEAGSGAEK